MKKFPEILSPAGDLERLKFAVLYGADAVYLGANQFGMRATPKNFSLEEIKQGVDFAHERGKRVYITMNTVPTNEEAGQMPEFMKQAAQTGIDAFIVADIGVLAMAKKAVPDMELHLSTQVGIMNYATANAAYELGAKRIVLARELELDQIAEIRAKTPRDLEIEAFVHGAMCLSFSGRCLLSQYLTGRDANRGECAQPCRWEWQLHESHRPDKYYDIGETEGGTYILNADDLCAAAFIDKVHKAGVDSFKIEGRAKSFYYVASVTAAYRKAMDIYLKDPDNYTLPKEVEEELQKTSHRNYSKGFFYGSQHATQNTETSSYIRNFDVVAVVENWSNGIAECTQRGKFTVGDTLEALLPNGDIFDFSPIYIKNDKGENVESTPHSMMAFSMPLEKEVPHMTIIRKAK